MKQLLSRIKFLLVTCQEPVKTKLDAFLVALIGSLIFAGGLAFIFLMVYMEGGE